MFFATKKTQAPKRFRSLVEVLSGAFLALSLILLLFSTTLQSFSTFQAQREIIADNQRLIAKEAANTVEYFVKEKLAILDQAADVNNLAVSPDRRDVALNKILGRNTSFNMMIIVDTEGQELKKISRSSTSVYTSLEKFKKPILADVLKGKQYVSPVYVDEITNEPLVLLAVPAKDIFREVRGALIVEVNLKFMWNLVGSIKISQTGLAYVVDRGGQLIAFGDTSRVLARENLSHLAEVQEFLKNEEDVPATFSKGILNTNVVSSFVALGIPDWAVIVETPVFEAYSTLMRVLLNSLLAMILSVIFAVGFGSYFSRKITKGIVTLSNATEEIIQGKLDTKIEILPENEENEIGHLTVSFNIMTSKLKELYVGMDEKIKEKTADLLHKVTEIEKSKLAILNLLEDSRVLEDNLKTERDRSMSIISSMGEGLFLIDGNFKISLINPTAEKLFGLKPGEVLGKDIREAFAVRKDGEEVKSDDRPISRTILNNESVLTKLEDNVSLKATSSGKSFPVVQATTPIVVENLRGAVVVFRDVTEEKLLNDAKSNFISIASHQLRTPLTSVRWYSEILLDEEAGKLNDDQREFARQVHDGALRLFRTIDTLLALSRLESGKSQEDFIKIDLRSFSEDILKDMEALTKDRNLDLHIDIYDNIPDIIIGRFMLREVMTNLVANSIRYTHKGGKITLGFKYDGHQITGYVFDNGIGIPVKDKDKIFAKFYRASNAVEKVPDGSGLGLSLVKGFVEKWGGKIWFESTVDEGTTFYFTIPENCIFKKPE